MNCRETQQMIYRYLNNDLEEHELQAFLDHVRGCPSCYEELEIYYSIQEALDYLEKDGKGAMNPSELLKIELREKETMLHKQRMFWLWQMILVWAAVIAIAMTGVKQVQIIANHFTEDAAEETGEEDIPIEEGDQ